MVRADNDRLYIEGPISMDNASALLDAARAHIRPPQVAIDLGATTDIDSSAVALLLECRRVAQQQGINLKILNAPASIRSLGELYGVGALLAIE